jgi:membrane-bound lytic murein transglycosylase D
MIKYLFLTTLWCGAYVSILNAQIITPKDSVATGKNLVASKLDSSKPSSTASLVKEIYEQPVNSATNSKKGLRKITPPPVKAKLNPRVASFMQDYVEKNAYDLQKMKSWALPYFNMMDGVLSKYNLPKELKYLAVIESNLKPSLVSWVGAVGPWQFMPETAIRMGLKVNRHIDERKNYVRSTQAAAKYLTELYKNFGDWLLVIAAYNGGPGNVMKAVKKSGSNNFWALQYHLPEESRTHVKKFIATHYIFEGQGGPTTLTKQEVKEQYGPVAALTSNRNLTPTELSGIKSQPISGKYQSAIIAKNITMEASEFERYNPVFDRVMASADNMYELKLPADKMELFNANKYQILNESIQMMLSLASATAPTGSKKIGSDTRPDNRPTVARK